MEIKQSFDPEYQAFLIEKSILEEKPYNWKKHLIHQLPEMIYFSLKWIFYITVAQILLTTMALAVAETMLQLPKQI